MNSLDNTPQPVSGVHYCASCLGNCYVFNKGMRVPCPDPFHFDSRDTGYPPPSEGVSK